MSQPLEITPPAPDAPEPYAPKIDRRTALAWVGVVGAALAVGTGVVVYGPKMGGQPAARGYGTDPNLVHPAKAPWPRIMTSLQLQTAALVADFILPATATAPSASALGVPDFIDEWVSAPYPDQLKDRPLILDGLNGLLWKAKGRTGETLASASPAERAEILAALPAAKGPELAFFKRLRALTIGAYYTTPAGFKDIGYIGNVARAADPGPSDAVKAHLERELKKLGL
jgi:hypothetical protein